MDYSWQKWVKKIILWSQYLYSWSELINHWQTSQSGEKEVVHLSGWQARGFEKLVPMWAQESSKTFKSSIIKFRAGIWRQAQAQKSANRKWKCHSGASKLGPTFALSFPSAFLVLEVEERLHISWWSHVPGQGTCWAGSPCNDHVTTRMPATTGWTFCRGDTEQKQGARLCASGQGFKKGWPGSSHHLTIAGFPPLCSHQNLACL